MILGFGFLICLAALAADCLLLLRLVRTPPQPVEVPGPQAAHPRLSRQYLRRIRKDFGSVRNCIKAATVQSPVDRPDLASILLRQELRFRRGWIRAAARLI